MRIAVLNLKGAAVIYGSKNVQTFQNWKEQAIN